MVSTEVWQIKAKGGSGVELPRAVGLILDVTCLFHAPTTTTNVLKLIQALQELLSLVPKTLKVCSLTCEAGFAFSWCRKKKFETSKVSLFLLRALLVVLNEIRQKD